jgi:hypothetical protein
MAGSTRAAFIVTLNVPDVWFRDPTLLGEGSYVSRADTDQWAVTIDSDVILKDAQISLLANGNTPANIKIYNESLSAADNWIQYSDVMQDGEEVIIEMKTWRATLDGATRVTGNVVWSGQPQFFWLIPGQNDLKMEVTGGPVDVKVQAKGAYW